MGNKLFPALLLASCCVVAAAAAADEDKASTPSANTERANCIKDTGTRLKKRQGECVEVPGQVITREEIDRSGAATTGEALQKLSNSAQGRH